MCFDFLYNFCPKSFPSKKNSERYGDKYTHAFQ